MQQVELEQQVELVQLGEQVQLEGQVQQVALELQEELGPLVCFFSVSHWSSLDQDLIA